MKGWTEYKLKDISEGIYDGPHATPNKANSGAIFLGIKNLTEDGRIDLTDAFYISEIELKKWTKRVTPQFGDLVFSYEATLHRYALIPEGFHGCLGRRLALIRPNLDKLNIKYLFYLFLSPFWRSFIEANQVSGSTVDRIPLIKFPEYKIPLPSLAIQGRIVNILNMYDQLIDVNNQRIRILEETAREVYKDWFVRMRFPGYKRAKFLKGIPEKWKIKKLGQVIELAYGKALKEEDRNEGEYPVYGSSGIVGSHNSYIAKAPGIIVGRKGNVGSVFWATRDFYPIDTAFYVKSNISLYYIFFNLHHQNFIEGDSAVPGLNRNQAYSNYIIVPSKDALDNFDVIVKPIFDMLQILREQNADLKQIRDRLLPRLISGKLGAGGNSSKSKS